MKNLARPILALIAAVALAACGGGGGGAPAGGGGVLDVDYDPSVTVHVGGEQNTLPGTHIDYSEPV